MVVVFVLLVRPRCGGSEVKSQSVMFGGALLYIREEQAGQECKQARSAHLFSSVGLFSALQEENKAGDFLFLSAGNYSWRSSLNSLFIFAHLQLQNHSNR